MARSKKRTRPSESRRTQINYDKFSKRLKHWHFSHGITQNATSDLLHILAEEIPGVSEHLPVTASTFLETPRAVKVKKISLDLISLPKSKPTKKKKKLCPELAKALEKKKNCMVITFILVCTKISKEP